MRIWYLAVVTSATQSGAAHVICWMDFGRLSTLSVAAALRVWSQVLSFGALTVLGGRDELDFEPESIASSCTMAETVTHPDRFRCTLQIYRRVLKLVYISRWLFWFRRRTDCFHQRLIYACCCWLCCCLSIRACNSFRTILTLLPLSMAFHSIGVWKIMLRFVWFEIGLFRIGASKLDLSSITVRLWLHETAGRLRPGNVYAKCFPQRSVCQPS